MQITVNIKIKPKGVEALLKANRPKADMQTGEMPTDEEWLRKTVRKLAKDAVRSRIHKGKEILAKEQIGTGDEVE